MNLALWIYHYCTSTAVALMLFSCAQRFLQAFELGMNIQKRAKLEVE